MKAIYKPKGKAGEYAEWACNFYVGCSNGCEYCYLKKGRGSNILGGNKPTLKKCFKDEEHAMDVFAKELKQNLPELQTRSLFFSFTTDPLLYETKELTQQAVNMCLYNDVPVKLLTKKTDYIYQFAYELECTDYDLSNVAIGFTLTGHDELEPNANTNAERIEAMKKLHDAGFITWASIEPVIDFESSKAMIRSSLFMCDLYKIGLESGKKYNTEELSDFINWCTKIIPTKIYFKDSLLKQAEINREDLPENCVTKDYKLI